MLNARCLVPFVLGVRAVFLDGGWCGIFSFASVVMEVFLAYVPFPVQIELFIYALELIRRFGVFAIQECVRCGSFPYDPQDYSVCAIYVFAVGYHLELVSR